ncbi:unnamed protein product [Allacma fusca]|uniref:Tetraspanin n=1 Tax=Allacma fusca TaxID=39272 RepID=A0A8J2LIP3_9HEXA|nr:unnamed protein product [Allacma fusca]
MCGFLDHLETESELTLLMFLACTCTITMALLGCCCVKLDVQHTCCAIWYIIPTLLCNLLLCTSMLVFLRSAGSELHEEGDVLRTIRHELETKRTIPKFLAHTQLHYGCCGVYGFKDYRAFFLPPSITQDVPYGCCNDPTTGVKMKCPSGDKNEDPRMTVYNIYLVRTIQNVTLPYDIPSDQEDPKLEPIVTGLYGTLEEHGNAPERYLSSKLDLPVNITKVKNINLQGCFEHLKTNSQLIHNYYFAFSLFLIVSSLIMCIIFGRNCVKARRSQRTSIQKLILETLHQPHKVSALNPEMGQAEKDELLHNLMHDVRKSEDNMVSEQQADAPHDHVVHYEKMSQP